VTADAMTHVGNDVVNHGAVRFRMETRAIIWRRLIMVSRAYDGGTDPGRLFGSALSMKASVGPLVKRKCIECASISDA